MNDIAAKETTISIAALEEAAEVNPKLLQRLRTADLDKDGQISAQELVHIIQDEQKAKADRKLLIWVIAALAVLLVLNIAATAGLTYGIVYLSKDTNVQNNVLVAKGGNGTVATGNAITLQQLSDLYKVSGPEDLLGVDKLILPNGNNSFDIFGVTSMSLVPNTSLTMNITAGGPEGSTLVIDSTGVYYALAGAMQQGINGTDAGAAPMGRRLKAAMKAVGSNSVVSSKNLINFY